ncbi:MAG: c-type cytochrome [Pseudomonadota bacterium]|uniref:c-type cytochrome n=1 Tax=Thermithiobacillus tepidarius TaxID=929 RepID=UPI000423E4E4|nr:cytochrome c [Thermithiobacillus tepidarius]
MDRQSAGGHDPRQHEKSTLRIHGALLREAEEPNEAAHTGPWWLWAAVVLTVFVGGFYLGKHVGPFGTAPYTGYLPVGVGPGQTAPAAKTVSGAAVFTSHCATCHQANGMGVPGTFPPLAGSDIVQGDPETVVRIILDGLQGPVTVKGGSYNGHMPAWKNQLSDAEIAAVATHIRSMGGNRAGPVDPQLVAKIRQADSARTQPWTMPELQAQRSGA